MVIVGLCEGPNSVLWDIVKDEFEGRILICPSPQEHQAGFAPRWIEVLSWFALQPSCIEFVCPMADWMLVNTQQPMNSLNTG